VENLELQAASRELEGKRVRHLRAKGILPANLFGHGVASKSLQVNSVAFAGVLARAGTNTLVNLKIDGASEPTPVLIRGVQRNCISRRLEHADLYKVSLTEKIRLSVPLVFAGDAPGVTTLGGMLLHNMDKVEIECLPGDLVHSITVDVSGLKEIGAALFIKDLVTGPGVTIQADAEELVVKITPPAKEEVVAVVEEPASDVEVVAKKKAKEEGTE
jgi:large subunit ribosomal protein L25